MQSHPVTVPSFGGRCWGPIDLAQVTILLDVDGTILDVAATPQGVVVPASLVRTLDELHKRGGQTLGELCQHLDMTRQAVTKHLLLLEAANLVATLWRGREKLHYLNPAPLHDIYERWIAKYERHRLQALSDLKKGLEQNKNTKK